MIDGELLAKFDCIQDLPVSEEMLGAYFENKLDDTESAFVSNAIDNDLSLMNLSHDVSCDYNIDENNFDIPVIEFEDPSIITNEDLEVESHEQDDFSYYEQDDFNLPDIDEFFSNEDFSEQDTFE